MRDETIRLLQLDAVTHIDVAIAICDQIGASQAACYLQMAEDLLRGEVPLNEAVVNGIDEASSH